MSKLLEVYGKEIEQIIAQYPEGRQKSAVMPLLHLAQQVYGYASDEAKADIASLIGLDPTQVMSIAGFYTLYHEVPTGKYVIEICNDLACSLNGADQFLEMACDKLGVKNHETTADGQFTVHNVMCIGACHRAPVMQVNLKFEENLDEKKFDQIIKSIRSGAYAEANSLTPVDRAIARHTK